MRVQEMIRQSCAQLLDAASGFDDSNRCKQVVNLPNHGAWTIGHVAGTLASVHAALLHERLPVEDFTDGQCDGLRFSMAMVQHGSSPQADAGLYPGWARSLDILARCVDRFVLIGNLLPQGQTIPWEGRPVSFELLAIRYSLHTAYHAGQLASLRSALRQK